jgi:hypothetical protein
MATEDHDFEEINYFFQRKFRWNKVPDLSGDYLKDYLMFFDCMPRNWVQTNAETEKFI